MHLRSKRIVLKPQLLRRRPVASADPRRSSASSSSRRLQKSVLTSDASRHSTTAATDSSNGSVERKSTRYRFSDSPVGSGVLIRRKTFPDGIHPRKSTPAAVASSQPVREDESFVVGRRTTRAMDGGDSWKLMPLDVASPVRKHENREKRDFLMNNDVNKHRKVRFQSIENSGSKSLPQRRETIGIYVRNCRSTRLQVKKQEDAILQRGRMDCSEEESVHHDHEKENYRIHPLLPLSRSSRDAATRGRKNAGNNKCKFSLISRNKRRNDVNLAGNKRKEVKKMRLSQAELCVEDSDVSKSNNHGPSNLNFLKETMDIQDLHNTQECKIKRREDNLQRKFPTRILRNSKPCGKESLAELKEDMPHILVNSKQPPEEHLPKNKGGSVYIATRSSRQKRVREHDLDNKNNRGASRSMQSMHPAEESERWSIEGMEENRYGLGGNNNEADRPKIVGSAIDVISATEEVAQDCSPVLDMENMKFDPTSKWCLIRTDPSETGGRRMRPRPLSLEQPLLILIEGQDQDYHELDGGLFYQTLQQAEAKISPSSKIKKGRKLSKVSTTGRGEIAQNISIPSFRCLMKSDGVLPKGMPPYTLPKAYIKAIPEVQSGQPEYDIDEEDEEWLKRYNQTVPPTSILSVDQYEKIVDLLETKVNNSNDVLSDMLDANEKDQDEHVECCICNGGENSAENLILQCAVCRIHVHQFCYGVQEFEIFQRKQEWRCRKCEAVAARSESGDISCALCCKEGGALKPATEPNKWAHVVCALYTNETYFVDTDAMEPIKGLDSAVARAKRQRRQCFLCGKREGCAERCSVPGCKATFHVSCGVTQGASFKLLHSNQQVTSVLIYCPKHASTAVDAPSVSLEKGQEARDKRARKRPSRKEEIHSTPCGEALHRNNANGTGGKLLRCVNSNPDDFKGLDQRSSHFVEGICLHWLSKRTDYGGSLLHHVQQERAKKQFSIFNPVEEAMTEDTLHAEEERFEHKGGTSEMVLRAWKQLNKAHQISNLVVEREKLKLGLHLADRDIFKASLDALKVTGDAARLCSTCRRSRLSLSCTACHRNTCFYCFRKVNQCRSWLSSLKSPKYVCAECGKHSACKHSELEDCKNDNCLAWPRRCSLKEVDCNNSSLCPTKKKPCMLLPRTESVDQDKLATEAFWERNHLKKTLLVTDILKCVPGTS